MIDIEALKERPKVRVAKPRRQPLPIATDTKIIEVTRQKIDAISRSADKAFHSFHLSRYSISSYNLFSGDAERRYSNLYAFTGDDAKAPAIARAKSTRMQQLVFGLMQEYGLDENISIPDPSMSYPPNTNGIQREGNGIVMEWRAYPSQKIPGLKFTRARSFYLATGDSISFTWHVSDGLAPDIKVGPVAIFPERVKETFQTTGLTAGK